jgi:hypothetical protein
MRKLKTLWRSALSPRLWEELEALIGVLLALGAAALLFVTLKGQGAYGSAPRPAEAVAREVTLSAVASLPALQSGARGTPRQEAYVHAMHAPGMPPTRSAQRRPI